MNRYLSLLLMSKNNIGIVSKVSKSIYLTGSNIINSNMYKINNNFIMDIDLIAPKNFNFSNIDFGEVTLLNVTNKKNSLKKRNEQQININVTLADSPGIIHALTNKLSYHNMDITHLNSHMNLSSHSCSPIFNVNILSNVSKNMDINQLHNELHEDLNSELGCEIDIKIVK